MLIFSLFEIILTKTLRTYHLFYKMPLWEIRKKLHYQVEFILHIKITCRHLIMYSNIFLNFSNYF